jgi:hypothetical protein
MYFGPVLTNAKDIPSLMEYRNAGRFDAIKVITSWGLDTGWNSISRAQLLTLTPNPIVRTSVGDPSNKSVNQYLIPEEVITEISPWVLYKPDVMIELGNEPNSNNKVDPWVYRYYLNETIKRIREVFRYARVISPALIVNEYTEQWVDILHDVVSTCDYVGIHAYEHHTFDPYTILPRTKQLEIMNAYYIGAPKILTEFGINVGVKRDKMLDYRELLINLTDYVGAYFYHYNMRGDIDPQYHIPLKDV